MPVVLSAVPVVLSAAPVILSAAKDLLSVRTYFVYVAASPSKTLYIGVTNDLQRRMYEHKSKLVQGFTRRYNVTRLVYFEETGCIEDAIARETQLKGWTRAKKVALIESGNPEWEDLATG